MRSVLAASVLPILASAHFTLNWPEARGFEDSTAATFPCGGFNTVQSNRTSFPMTDAPIQLNLHHTKTYVEVLLAIGEDPGSAFNIVLRPTFLEKGPGNFCLGGINIPSSLNISDGTPATIQVVSNGDPDGGLYQCADVTLTTDTLSSSAYSSHCTNGTSQEVELLSSYGNPNETSTSTSTSTSGTAAASATSAGLAAAPMKTLSPWIVGAVGLSGALAAL